MNNQKNSFDDMSDIDILNILAKPETGGDLVIKSFIREATTRAIAVTMLKYGHVGKFIGTPLEQEIKEFHKSMMLGSIWHLMDELGVANDGTDNFFNNIR